MSPGRVCAAMLRFTGCMIGVAILMAPIGWKLYTIGDVGLAVATAPVWALMILVLYWGVSDIWAEVRGVR